VVGEAGRPAAISPEALKQVLLSLVQNASEAQDGGGGVGTDNAREPVEIRLADAGDEVTIEVVDRGPGIPDEILGRVFDPFFTTKEQASGTGLGLYVAEGVVRRHGGSLSARNREDGPGALFRIVVPTAGKDS
jgi:signal transduction histidine kinase